MKRFCCVKLNCQYTYIYSAEVENKYLKLNWKQISENLSSLNDIVNYFAIILRYLRGVYINDTDPINDSIWTETLNVGKSWIFSAGTEQ